MKNTIKLLGIIALAAVIGFTALSCSGGGGGSSGVTPRNPAGVGSVKNYSGDIATTRSHVDALWGRLNHSDFYNELNIVALEALTRALVSDNSITYTLPNTFANIYELYDAFDGVRDAFLAKDDPAPANRYRYTLNVRAGNLTFSPTGSKMTVSGSFSEGWRSTGSNQVNYAQYFERSGRALADVDSQGFQNGNNWTITNKSNITFTLDEKEMEIGAPVGGSPAAIASEPALFRISAIINVQTDTSDETVIRHNEQLYPAENFKGEQSITITVSISDLNNALNLTNQTGVKTPHGAKFQFSFIRKDTNRERFLSGTEEWAMSDLTVWNNANRRETQLTKFAREIDPTLGGVTPQLVSNLIGAAGFFHSVNYGAE